MHDEMKISYYYSACGVYLFLYSYTLCVIFDHNHTKLVNDGGGSRNHNNLNTIHAHIRPVHNKKKTGVI